MAEDRRRPRDADPRDYAGYDYEQYSGGAPGGFGRNPEGRHGFGREGYGREFGGRNAWDYGRGHGRYGGRDYARGPGHEPYGAYGREGPHRGRGPRGYQRSDARIGEDVNDRLTDDFFVDATDIEVSVSEGEVTLDGKVNNRAEKRRAEDIAADISGVRHVQNNLRADRPEATAPGGA